MSVFLGGQKSLLICSETMTTMKPVTRSLGRIEICEAQGGGAGNPGTWRHLCLGFWHHRQDGTSVYLIDFDQFHLN